MGTREEPAIEVRINFGVFAGRPVTPAEIDALASSVSELVPAFAIVAEERHEFGGAVEASVHQVVVEVESEHAGPEADVLAERIVLDANGWALECIESRHAEL
jgi:hypothetical protein